MDIYLTKDLKPVVFHDTNLMRLAGDQLKISDFNYKSDFHL